MKKVIIVIVLLAVAGGIFYVSQKWPFEGTKNLKGTLGGVEKVKRFKNEELASQKVDIDNPEFAKLLQSPEWQNAIKNEAFVKALMNGDFQKRLILNGVVSNVMNTIVLLNQVLANKGYNGEQAQAEVNKLYSNDAFKHFYCAKVLKSLHAKDYESLMNTINKSTDKNKWKNTLNWFLNNPSASAIFNSESNLTGMFKVAPTEALKKIVFNMFLNENFNNRIGSFANEYNKITDTELRAASNDFNKAFIILSTEFNMWVANEMNKALYLGKDTEKNAAHYNNDMQKMFNGDFNKMWSRDFEAFFGRRHNNDANKAVFANNNDANKARFSNNDTNKAISLSNDANKAMGFNSDFNKMAWSNNFNQLIFSNEFMGFLFLAKGDQFNMFIKNQAEVNGLSGW